MRFLAVIFLMTISVSYIVKNNTAACKYSLQKKEIVIISCALDCKLPGRKTTFKLSKQAAAVSKTKKEEMVRIPSGIFIMGTNAFVDSRPLHEVKINSFLMDEHEVTNAQFEKFVNATGYITVAERPLDKKDYPGVPVEKLVPGSAVFTPPLNAVKLNDAMQWWTYVASANWKKPKGKQDLRKNFVSLPVVQVCYQDAIAYAAWAGKRLPTEAEWEYAARANQPHEQYYWGKLLKPFGKWAANIFQGNFPYKNTLEDGYGEVAPVKSFAPNAFGLYDMEGNVWEWCYDFYRPDYYKSAAINNPKGPTDSYDPEEPGLEKHVQRGGSFLCSDQYCTRYKAGSRGKGETGSAGNNLGFRCAKDL